MMMTVMKKMIMGLFLSQFSSKPYQQQIILWKEDKTETVLPSSAPNSVIFLLVMLLSITQGNAHKGNQAYTTLKGVVLLSKKAMTVCYGGESICDNKSIFLQISSNNAWMTAWLGTILIWTSCSPSLWWAEGKLCPIVSGTWMLGHQLVARLGRA